jgi:hypothetical protein
MTTKPLGQKTSTSHRRGLIGNRLVVEFLEKKRQLCSASDGVSKTHFGIKRLDGPSRRVGIGL